MESEEKLSESNYFLMKLKEIERQLDNDPGSIVDLIIDFKANLSAFIQSWRSVFDFLLYDYAEKYFEIDRGETYLDKRLFQFGLKIVSSPEAGNFLKWYKEKESILGKQHLWYLRNLYVHRGGSATEVKIVERRDVTWQQTFGVAVMPSNISAGTVPPGMVYSGGNRLITVPVETTTKELYVGDFNYNEIIDMCEKCYELMHLIVKEASLQF
jgi:hypothetical protein